MPILRSRPRILGGGNTGSCQCAHGPKQSWPQFGGRRLRHDSFNKFGGGLLQRTGWLASSVAHDLAVARVRCALSDAGQLEGPRIGPTRVAVEALEIGRAIWHDSIELVASRHAAGKRRVEPAAPDNPGGRALFLCVAKDGLLNPIKVGEAKEVETVE